MDKVKVSITGLGAVSPLGLNFEDTFAALVEGRSAVRSAPDRISALIPSALAASVAPEFVKSVPRPGDRGCALRAGR